MFDEVCKEEAGESCNTASILKRPCHEVLTQMF